MTDKPQECYTCKRDYNQIKIVYAFKGFIDLSLTPCTFCDEYHCKDCRQKPSICNKCYNNDINGKVVILFETNTYARALRWWQEYESECES